MPRIRIVKRVKIKNYNLDMEQKKNKKITSKQQEVDRVFAPNSNGYSEWITREILDTNDKLSLGKNGAGRHGIFFGDARYIWEKDTRGTTTSALRLQGFSEDYLHGAERPIRDDIHAFHKPSGAACIVCGSKSALCTDHKNDLYNDRRVLNRETQTPEDFQCLCNHCNLQKRRIAVVTKQTNKRYKATNIPQLAWLGVDFIEGDETFDSKDPNAMVGTYWYDPVLFLKRAQEIYIERFNSNK